MKITKTFEYEIVEHIATLSQTGTVTKELNRVSYNGSAAKYDLRNWKRDETGIQPLKGLTFTEEELEILGSVLAERSAKR